MCIYICIYIHHQMNQKSPISETPVKHPRPTNLDITQRHLRDLIYIHTKSVQTDLENKLMVTRGEGWGGGIVSECGTDMYTLLYLKWITNKDLLYSTGNSAQYYGTT